MRLCAICVKNIADRIEEDEGKKFFACTGCVGAEPEPVVEDKSTLVALVRRHPGLTGGQVADQVAEDRDVRRRVQTQLASLANRGRIRAVRIDGQRTTYWPAETQASEMS